MAKGRMYSKQLREEMIEKGYTKEMMYELITIHQCSDDEGYIKTKVAMAEIDLDEDRLRIYAGDKFIGMNEKVIKCYRWLTYQSIRSDRYTPSVIKKHWHIEMERDDAVPKKKRNKINIRRLMQMASEKIRNVDSPKSES